MTAITLVELVWDRKYDESGTKLAPLRIVLPFQTIETLNESSQQRQKSIESFLNGRGEIEWRNRLIWGDKKYVLPSLLPEFAGKVKLIYIDPPFATGDDFSFAATIPSDPEDDETRVMTFDKEPTMIEQKAYRDTWGMGARGETGSPCNLNITIKCNLRNKRDCNMLLGARRCQR